MEVGRVFVSALVSGTSGPGLSSTPSLGTSSTGCAGSTELFSPCAAMLVQGCGCQTIPIDPRRERWHRFSWKRTAFRAVEIASH